jgi:hypothetical protein
MQLGFEILYYVNILVFLVFNIVDNVLIYSFYISVSIHSSILHIFSTTLHVDCRRSTIQLST